MPVDKLVKSLRSERRGPKGVVGSTPTGRTTNKKEIAVKLTDLHEMTMAVGNLDLLATAFVNQHKGEWQTGEHVGDIEQYEVRKFGDFFSVWLNDEIVSSLKTLPSGDVIEVRNLWTSREYRGLKLMSKLLWFLKSRMNYSRLLIGDVHSLDTQTIIKGGLSRFEKSWFKDGKKEPFALDTLDKFYHPGKPTGWRILLENDGDFSSWPKFAGDDFVRDNYDWQIE